LANLAVIRLRLDTRLPRGQQARGLAMPRIEAKMQAL